MYKNELRDKPQKIGSLFPRATINLEQALIILRNLKATIFDSLIVLIELSKKQKTIFVLLKDTMPMSSGI